MGRSRFRSFVLAAVVLAAGLPVLVGRAAPIVEVAREAEPVVVPGSRIPDWSRLPAVGEPVTWPNGALTGERDAHAGTLHVPPDVRTGVPVDQILAARWDGSKMVEIPVQVDERFPYFLSNINSDFAIYSAVDEELTYAWDVESWAKTAGTCFTEYPDGVSATTDPAEGLDDDDEIAFMASDAGAKAPPDARGPVGTGDVRQEITVIDPLDPTGISYVYLYLRPSGASFDATNGYVNYDRDENADQWIDRTFFTADDPEKLGTSNSGYGPNLDGTVCDGEAVRESSDRFPRDGVTVRTDSYEWRATGRWMVRDMRVAKPGQPGAYGPDLIDRWKGRAFQQSPDSAVSLVGFEDEQVNWEANSALIGERAGPVRAIRETWGADSGTNTTKTETFYRDAVTYHYHLRVHPVPLDGIYQNWDYNAHVATRYFNALKPDGVSIDGVPDDFPTVEEEPATGTPFFMDVVDPSFNVPLATLAWQQVSGRDDSGSLVYISNADSPTTAQNPAAYQYYNDDKCFDDGTGDNPVQRPWPGEPTTDQRVIDGYSSAPTNLPPTDEVTCDEKQGAWGSHGLHVYFTGDTDNAFQSKPITESAITEWQFTVPTGAPAAVGEPYANAVRAPLVPVATRQSSAPMQASTLELGGATSGEASDAATITARLTTASGAPIANAAIDIALDDETITDRTDDAGVAVAVFALHGPAGTRELAASFDGDGSNGAASDAGTFTVSLEETAVDITAPAEAVVGETMSVSARLSENDGPVAGAPMTFTFDGEEATHTATTSSDGVATIEIRAPGPAGDHSVTATYGGDGDRLSSSGTGAFSVVRGGTRMTVLEPLSGVVGEQVTLRARLVDAAGEPLVGEDVTIAFGDSNESATTDGGGIARRTITLAGPARAVGVAAGYLGTDRYTGASDVGTFTISKGRSQVSFVASKRRQKQTTVTVRLVDRTSGAPLGGRSVTIWLERQQSATVTTDATGGASATFRIGAHGTRIDVIFPGDDSYNGATASAQYRPKQGAQGSSG